MYNMYNEVQFSSFSNIEKDFKERFSISDYASYLTNVFKVNINQHLIINLYLTDL